MRRARRNVLGQNWGMTLRLRVELERETAERWIADVVTLPGVLVYGRTRAEALERAQALALEVIADRLKHGEDLLTGHALKTPAPGARRRFQALEFATA
jgi:predicted RNase H-like HicB family nuclease